ncbi:uncharacterized protein GLRG_09532 [Colletotrichum graminicola M1.001]|uniref:Uncharacterized protein n=1 Tax=Colletotrichum graminicola (strain M1.001 / M2 / FGSC 10212) TaxID=645133 RepID=E3QU50_COLGM|nr:uncharacterized protein GLRG_09532 [Colletotrichum graminicola M1.001]EFQ34388.1 hypothetical protein GLRG_09532 [Colletotrichum graminicola M1.001]
METSEFREGPSRIGWRRMARAGHWRFAGCVLLSLEGISARKNGAPSIWKVSDSGEKRLVERQDAFTQAEAPSASERSRPQVLVLQIVRMRLSAATSGVGLAPDPRSLELPLLE